jgi:hypothetical protein
MTSRLDIASALLACQPTAWSQDARHCPQGPWLPKNIGLWDSMSTRPSVGPIRGTDGQGQLTSISHGRRGTTRLEVYLRDPPNPSFHSFVRKRSSHSLYVYPSICSFWIYSLSLPIVARGSRPSAVLLRRRASFFLDLGSPDVFSDGQTACGIVDG